MKAATPSGHGSAPDLLSVVLVSGGRFQGLAAIRALRASGSIRVVMTDWDEENVGRYLVDAFHRVPPIAETQAFVASIKAVCEAEGARLVVPCTDFELETLARHRADLEQVGARVAVSDLGLLEWARDKRALYPRLLREGLPTLPVADPRDPGAPFPLIGKPARSWGSRGIVVVRAPDELDPRLLESHVFQPRLEDFTELSADFSIDLGGVVSAIGLRSRLATTAGFSVVTESVVDPESERLVRRFAEIAARQGGRGMFNVQVLRHEGRRYVSDVNPRIGTSSVHWPGVGFHPILHLCASVEPGLRPPSSPEPWPRRRMVRFLEERWLDIEERAPSEPIQGVVFDLDDTLLHQKHWMQGKLRAVADSLPQLIPDPDAFLLAALQRVEEGPRDALIDELAEGLALQPEGRRRLLETYRAAIPKCNPLFPDVLPTLESLRRAGLKLALLTDNPPVSQRQKIEACDLARWFDAIVYSQELGAEKPDAGGFATCAQRLGLPAERLACVGDNPYRDALGAHAAGYAWVYVIRRRGTFYNFDVSLLGDLPGGGRFRVLNDLQWLLADLAEQRRES